MQDLYISEQGFVELKEKLAYLRGPARQINCEKLIEARSHGDLSENSEYKAAKEEQDLLETDIVKVEAQIENAKIYKKSDLKGDVIGFGSVVKIIDEDEDTIEYKITGALESDPLKNIISNESPVGKALMGKKKGDMVDVLAPRGKFSIKIVSVKN